MTVNSVFYESLPFAMDCEGCGVSIPKGDSGRLYDDDSGVFALHEKCVDALSDNYAQVPVIHYGEQDIPPEVVVPVEPDATTVAPTVAMPEGRPLISCPYCNAVSDENGDDFAAKPNPSASLGNHKKWCRSNPRNAGGAPRRSGGARVAPAGAKARRPKNKYATTTTTTTRGSTPPSVVPAPALVPVGTASSGLPDHYQSQLDRQRSEAVAEFTSMLSVLGDTPLSERGKQVVDLLRMCQVARQPVFLRGGSGVGKSVGVRIVAAESSQPVVSINLTKATRMEALIGQPVFRGSDQPIGWNDGMLGLAARNGYICNLEEVTRSPETIARLFSITDQLGRSLPLTENPYESNVSVHPDFWLVASGNPTGGGYHTGELDTAFLSRFFVINIDEPMADEQQVLTNKGMKPNNVTRLLEFASDLRKQVPLSPINTRDLVQVADLTNSGMSFSDAIHGSIAMKMKDEVSRSAVVTTAALYKFM